MAREKKRSGPDVAWLDPVPDTLAIPEAADPAVIVTARESLRLALIASLQYLPPRQRAVLVLRDVLDFPTTQVAVMLDPTTASVEDGLQRARARLEEVAPAADQITEPDIPQARALLDEYIAAFENADAVAIERLLVEDVILEATPLGSGSRAAVPHPVPARPRPRHRQRLADAGHRRRRPPAAAVYARNEERRVAALRRLRDDRDRPRGQPGYLVRKSRPASRSRISSRAGYDRAIRRGNHESATVTSGQLNRQVRPCSGVILSDSQCQFDSRDSPQKPPCRSAPVCVAQSMSSPDGC